MKVSSLTLVLGPRFVEGPQDVKVGAALAERARALPEFLQKIFIFSNPWESLFQRPGSGRLLILERGTWFIFWL